MRTKGSSNGARPAKWAVLLFVALVVCSCKKPEESLGLDLIPEDELLGTVEMVSSALWTYSIFEDPVRTSGLSRNMLGAYNDQEFGLIKASVVTQVRLSTNNVGTGQDNSGLVLDSIVLALDYSEPTYAYGDLDPQIFRVFEVGEELSIDSIYKNDHVPQLIGSDLSYAPDRSIQPRPLDGVVVGGDSLDPQLRIRLRDELGRRFLDEWGNSTLTDNTSFLQYFKGLYVTVKEGTRYPYHQGILYLDLLSNASKVTIYYRDTLGGSADTLAFDLLINANAVRYTVCEHDHSLAFDPNLYLSLEDTARGAQRNYVQACGGLRTVVRPLDMNSFADMDLEALAKAELVVPLDGPYYPYYEPPTQLFIFRKGTEGQDLVLPDQLESYGPENGLFDLDERAYRFNITRYFQGLLLGDYENTGVQLVAGSNGVSVSRVILGGSGNDQARIKLILTFTTL